MSKTINDFIAQYQACTREELIQLEKTKGDLVDEAVEALNHVLKVRKSELAEVRISTTKTNPKRDWAVNIANALATCLGAAVAMTFHWGAIPVVILGATGWYGSKQVVKFIKNGQAPDQRKKFLLWALIPAYLIFYFVVVGILSNS